MTRPM